MSDITIRQPSQTTLYLDLITRAAADPNVDVAKMQALLDMQERIMGRQAEMEFNTAFSAMEPKIPRIKKDGLVEYKGSKAFKFATWEAIDHAIRPILREHGFSLSFQTAPAPNGMTVTGTLLHTSGHSRSSSILLAVDTSGGKNAIQGTGSTFSYGCRYTTRMLLNIVTDDDDDGRRGGMEFITPAQVDQLLAAMNSTKTDIDRFFQVMGIEAATVSEIEARDLPRLLNALETKRQKMEGKS